MRYHITDKGFLRSLDKMKFVIQHNMMNTEQLEIIRSAVLDLPHTFVGMIPFSHEITSDEPLEGVDYIPYGSTLMTTIVSQSMGWKGLHFNLDTFNYEAACKNRDDMLNDEFILSVKNAILFMKSRKKRSDWFIRPSKDLKQFSGQVIEASECAEWLQDAVNCASSGTYQLDENEVVVIAKPKTIQAEWRWFIVDGKIIDGAMYRCHDQLVKKHETDQAVIDEAQELANGWLPDSCVVMDTALVDDMLYVVEFNCINSSGLYGHDAKKIFKALYDYHM